MAFQYLFAPTTQFQARTGANNTAGFLRVFYTQTDDRAVTYSDFGGTENEADIVLDNDGRAVVIVDDSKTYRLEVYGVNRNLLFTVDPLTAVGGGSGGANITNVVSTDGTVAITVTSIGGVVTYDLSTAFEDNPSSWGNALSMISDLDGSDQWVQIPVVSSVGSSLYDNGWTAGKDTGYDIAASVEMPTGSNTAIYGIDVKCEVQVDGVTVLTELGRIDPTTPMDRVSFEWKGELTKGQKVDTKLYVKNGEAITLGLVGRALFNEECDGIVGGGGGNEYIPGEYIDISTANVISVTGVQPLSGMSSYVPYSSIGGNADSQITGINGSAIAVPFDSATVSSIASAYAESAFSSISSWTADFSSISSKADSSSLSAYQPVSAMSGYATEAYVDARVGDKLDATASSLFLTSLPDDLATTGDIASAVSGKLDKSASGEFYPMTGNPSGFLTAHQSLAEYATEQYVDSAVSSKLDTSAFASASAGFAPTGDYAYNSSLSAYYPASASGAFQPSGNYQTAGDYAFNSAVSVKLDASASSSFVVNSSMTSWIPYSALNYSGTAISGIGGSSLAGMGGGGADYTGVYPVNVDNTAREISVDSIPLVTDSSMTAYGSAGSSVIGVNLNILTGKLDSSAQVVTATATQLYAGTSYLTSVNGAPVSASRAGNAANASLANSAYYDGTGRLISALPDSADVSAIASAYVESAASSKQDTLSFSYDDDKISAINGSALAGQGGGGGMITSIESSLDPWYQTAISGLNGSSLYPKWAASASMAASAGTATYATNAQSAAAAPTAWASSFITGVVSPSGTIRVLGGTAIESTNSAVLPSTVIDGFSVVGVCAGSTNTTSFTVPESNPSTRVHFGDAYGYGTFTIDTDNGLSEVATLEGGLIDLWFDMPNATSFTASYPWMTNVGYTASASAHEVGGGVGELAWASALSGYIPTSMSSDFQQVSGMSSYALSADVSATVDLVGTQSANWGGSALALSAGPGISLTMVGNTLVISTAGV